MPKGLNKGTLMGKKHVSNENRDRVRHEGMATITSLFAKQNEIKPDKVSNDNGDVIITGIANKHDSGSLGVEVRCLKKSKLKLKKSSPSTETKNETLKCYDKVASQSKGVAKLNVLQNELSLKKRKSKGEEDFSSNKKKKIHDSSEIKKIQGDIATKESLIEKNVNNNGQVQRENDLSYVKSEQDSITDDLLDEKNLHLKMKASTQVLQCMDNEQDTEEQIELNEYNIPYYLENFHTVIDSVIGDADNDCLLNLNDRQCIQSFKDLSECSQQLYIRLFTRKLAWIPGSRIKYPKIAEDLSPFLKELIEKSFILPVEELQDLETALKIMQLNDIKTLGKMYHINITSQNKEDIMSALLKKSKQNTIASMFVKSSSSGTATMLSRAKSFLGDCIHLSQEKRSVFIHLLMLFCPTNNSMEDDNATAESNQLFQMLMVNIGKVVYPAFKVNKQHKIYNDRDAFIRFTSALLLEMEYLSAVERKNYEDAYELYLKAEATYKLEVKQNSSHDRSLPDFLRGFTSCGVYVGVMSLAVDILQRRKDYSQANKLLQFLLNQSTYCQTSRGLWSERLAVNLEVHCKQPQKALDVVEKALNDRYIRTGHRYALYQRAEKLCLAPKSKFGGQMLKFKHHDVIELPKVTLEGRVLPDNVTTAKYRFILEYTDDPNMADDLTFAGVEQFVLNYYLHNGYTHGIHAEGSILSFLLTIFLWDILFMDVPDVFRSTFQIRPLDYTTDHFYSSRKKQIDARLDNIKTSTEEELCSVLEEVWQKNEGCLSAKWELFDNLEHAQGFVRCLGGKKLSKILERHAHDPRHTRGGFPDLTLWNVNEMKVKICEVKGPGDRLSHKQILWIDYLVSSDVDAEVCHVKAVGTKKLKASS